ncbi:class I SAM-dependent methyltransferase [Deferrisoma palaeochoriense]
MGVPREAGKSSFGLIDRERFLAALPEVREGLLLDLGCGVGNYAFALAERLGDGVRVLGIDPWEEGVETLNREARGRGFADRVSARGGDAARLENLADASTDGVLFATVLHDLAERGEAGAALREAARVLRPGGWLAAVEFHKRPTPHGPPERIRLSPEDLSGLAAPEGFAGPEVTDLGEDCYVAVFRRQSGGQPGG